MEKKGQLTIFIIVAVVIVAAILLFLLFRSSVLPDIVGGKEDTNPQAFLDSCLGDKLKETVELISHQGGYTSNPLNRTFKFEDEKDYVDVSYLCYNQNYYYPCINQEPVLITHLKDEIKDYLKNDVQTCFNDFVESLEKRGNDVDATYNGFEIQLVPKKVILEIEGNLKITKADETTAQQNLGLVVQSRFYELAVLVQEINSQEARFCNFEHLGFMLLYPQFEIDKFRTGDSTTIYTVTHRDSKEWFRFAVRSCVIPPGF
tara:strand:- start:226 stop:1005 length:780 start_codon:yes stop_codon:yes gene_type:complete